VGNLKSAETQVYLDLVLQVLRQPQYHRPNAASIERDCETVMSRTATEGVSFLTKTMPKFGKAILEGIETGRLNPCVGFGAHGRTRLPAFMQDAVSRLFQNDGTLQVDPSPEALSYLEQVLFLCYKIELPSELEADHRVVSDFVKTEEDLAELALGESELLIVARSLITRVVAGFDASNIHPQHGPGAVATGETAERKWRFDTVYAQLEKFYPYWSWFTPRPAGVGFEFRHELAPRYARENGCAKVVLVPKDSRGPRLISAEPLAYQFIQQGLMRQLVPLIENHPLTRGHVNFRDQSVNGRLALESSKDKSLATLDLKEASDRVSVELVRRLFPKEVADVLFATRSVATRLPSGEVLPLRKFAPMGSALCFPVLSLVVYAVAVASIVLCEEGAGLQEGKAGVYVFGDDIIVPTPYVSTVMDALESVGLKVNRAKSFHASNFRESCGVDAFRGVLVTPTRLHTRWTGRRSDGNALASYAATANALHKKGYSYAATYIWAILEKTYGFIPWGLANSGYVCKECENLGVAELLNESLGVKRRWNRDLQRVEFKVPVVRSRKREAQFDDWGRLLRGLVSPVLDGDPSVVVEARSTEIKRVWAPVI